MSPMILAYSFAAAVAIAACAVFLFSRPIDEIIARVVPVEMAAAWRQYIKFALFTVTFVGGMRLTELTRFVTMHVPAGPPVTGGEALLEVLKSISGSLMWAAGSLLAFFAATLAIHAGIRIYQASRGAAAQAPRPMERVPAVPDRQPVGSERHSGASKERPRDEGSGRVL